MSPQEPARAGTADESLTISAGLPHGWRLAAAALALLIYALVIWKYMGAYAGGADPSGYLNSAKFLNSGVLHIEQPVISNLDPKYFAPYTFIPHALRPVGSHGMAALFPPGLPLAIVVAAHVAGWNTAPHVTMLAACLLGVLATAWLAAEWGLPWRWAWFAALLLAASPLYLVMSLHLMSDVPALTTATFAMVFAWKSRKRDAWALAAGAAVAAAVLVRPNNFLVLPPVCICLGLSWRRLLLLCAGGLPGAVFLCLYNHASYGHAFEIGYATYGNPSSMFSWSVIPATLFHYVKWLPVCLTPLVFLAPGLPCLMPSAPRAALALIVWLAAYLGFYVACVFTQYNWMNIRYLLPAFPACIVGSLLVVRSLLRTRAGAALLALISDRRRAAWITTTLVATVLIYDIAWSRKLSANQSGRFMAMFHNAAVWADAHLPANAVICGKEVTGAFFYYDSFTLVRSDCLDPTQWEELQKACAEDHRPIYAAMLFPIDDKDTLTKRLAGQWTSVGSVRDITFWRFDGP